MSQNYTFTSIFNSPICKKEDGTDIIVSKILIPRIQRPYAQGRLRERETKIRKQFLGQIFSHLCEGTVMDMNFVYGSVKETEKGVYTMELLDGQQRFTTLFLLHWFLLNREDRFEDEELLPIRRALKSFVYETRSTSTDFCQDLADYKCSFGNASPSQRIRQARWFYRSYEKDSTVSGMLVMLDDMNRYYQNCGHTGLLDRVNLLQFYVLPLVNYNHTEELYMKMNARGLPISVFDNFKADFTGAMNKLENLKEDVDLDGTSGGKVSHAENISIKLDTKWIDLFWNDGHNVDTSYMRFFTRYFACKYMIDCGLEPKELRSDKILNILYTQVESNKNDDNYLGFEAFKVQLDSHPEYITGIEKALDTLVKHKDAISRGLVPAWESEIKGNFLFESDASFTQTYLVIFGAIMEIIDAYKDFTDENYDRWMRIVWNIVENTDIDNLERASGTLRLLSTIIRYVANEETLPFYQALANTINVFTDTTWPRPFREEIEKARRIAEDERWFSQLKDIEKHPYLKGTTNFFYNKDMSLDSFSNNCKLVAEMFDADGITPDYRKDHLLIRAIDCQLTKWEGQLNNHYITEKSETHKYLKITLMNQEAVRKMFLRVLDGAKTKDDVKTKLATETTALIPLDGKTLLELQLAIAHNYLSTDVRLYDWMETQSQPVSVRWFKGHIAVAIPRVWFDRYLIDTNRDEIANDLMELYGLNYFEDEQTHTSLDDYNKYGHYKGENIFIYKNISPDDSVHLNVQFGENCSYYLFLKTNDKELTKRLREKVGGYIYDDLPYHLYLNVTEDGKDIPDDKYITKELSEERMKGLIDEWLPKCENAAEELVINPQEEL